jgi:hypothetical protein
VTSDQLQCNVANVGALRSQKGKKIKKKERKKERKKEKIIK